MSLSVGRLCTKASSLRCALVRGQTCQLSTTADLRRRKSKWNFRKLESPYEDIDFRIKAGVCFARPPVIASQQSGWYQGFMNVVDDELDEAAIPSDHDKRMDRLDKLKVAQEARASGEEVTEFTAQELSTDALQQYEMEMQIEEASRAAYVPATRQTQDDIDNNLTSSNRMLDRYLYLVVRHKSDLFSWTFPQVLVSGTVGLHEEALVYAAKFARPQLSCTIHNNAPSGFITQRYRSDDAAMKGDKVFVYMGIVKDGSIEEILDSDYVEHRWLPKEGVKDLFPKGSWTGVAGMLL